MDLKGGRFFFGNESDLIWHYILGGFFMALERIV
jgi:hypothetical protein